VNRRLYQAIALLLLLPVFYGTCELGEPVVRGLLGISVALRERAGGLLTLLGYLLTLLALVLVWAVMLLPLRARAGFGPLLGDRDALAARGLRGALADEQEKLDAAKRSDDPAVRVRYHATFAGVGVLISAGAAALTYALYLDGHFFATPIGFALVAPCLSAYHLALAFRYLLKR
jgi:hypothetical protein